MPGKVGGFRAKNPGVACKSLILNEKPPFFIVYTIARLKKLTDPLSKKNNIWVKPLFAVAFAQKPRYT